MKALNVLCYSSMGAVLLIIIGMVHYRTTNDNRELKLHVNDLYHSILQRDSIIRESYKPVNRLQVILGVDTLDGILTFKEKMLVSARQIHKLEKVNFTK